MLFAGWEVRITFFSCGILAYKQVCLRNFLIELAYVPSQKIKLVNEPVTQILDKKRCIKEHINFELLYASCI